jgi:hypothetical protein
MAVDATMCHVRIGMFVTLDPMPTGRIASIHPSSHTIVTHTILTTGVVGRWVMSEHFVLKLYGAQALP